jgi:hypothetical protein
MGRAIVLLIAGAALGASGVYLMGRIPVPTQEAQIKVPPQSIACESELSSHRARIAELEKRVAAQQPAAVTLEGAATEQLLPVPGDNAVDQAVAWRVSAVEKFIPLTENQKERLREKFKEEQDAREQDRESTAEPLEDIVGEDQAIAYRQQVQAAFERAQNQELDKEAVWISRKLALSPNQEQSMRTIFSDVESQIDKEFGEGQHGVALSAQQRVARMVAENKRRLQLRSDALKNVLQPSQYAAYVQEESQSAAADVEVFHDSGGSESK